MLVIILFLVSISGFAEKDNVKSMRDAYLLITEIISQENIMEKKQIEIWKTFLTMYGDSSYSGNDLRQLKKKGYDLVQPNSSRGSYLLIGNNSSAGSYNIESDLKQADIIVINDNLTWEDAVFKCSNMRMNYSDWYLASKSDLFYLYKHIRKYKDIKNVYYWTSEEALGRESEAYGVSFENGNATSYDKNVGSYVICVEDKG